MSLLEENKCLACGGALNFDTKLQKLKCPYCDSVFDIEALRQRDEILEKEVGKSSDEMTWEMPQGNEWASEELENKCLYHCKSCGAEIIGDKVMASTNCVYCGNTIIIMDQFRGGLKPDYIIPFKLDKVQAKERLKAHLKNKKFLPRAFKDENKIDEIKGIYVPFWLFDTDVNAEYRFNVTRENVYSTDEYNYLITEYYLVSRSGQLSFQKIPVDGSKKIDDELMSSIEPFDNSELKEFETAYLAGYLADRYDVDEKESIRVANERIKESTENLFKNSVKGRVISVESENIKLSKAKAKYALYPVWLLNTTYRGEKYTFAMNGQTGKFVGNLPMDRKLYVKWFSVYTALITPIAFALIWYFNLL